MSRSSRAIVFGKSTLLADEYGGYFYAWIVLLGAVHLLRSDKYLTVTLLTDRLSPRGRNAAAIFAGVIGLGVSLVSLSSTYSIVQQSWMFGTRSMQPSATPLIYPQARDADRLRPAVARLCRGNSARASSACRRAAATTIPRPTGSETSVELGDFAAHPRPGCSTLVIAAWRAGRGRDGARRHRRHHAAARHAALAEPRRHHLEHRQLVHAGRDPAVRADGRDHPAQRRGAALLHGPRGAAEQRAGRARAVQHHGLRAVLGDLRLLDRDRADHRHRRAAGNAQARLQRHASRSARSPAAARSAISFRRASSCSSTRRWCSNRPSTCSSRPSFPARSRC